MLKEGSMVTVPRTLADIVVTEFGVAQLRGKTHRETGTGINCHRASGLPRRIEKTGTNIILAIAQGLGR